jgi:hypothetical protein
MNTAHQDAMEGEERHDDDDDSIWKDGSYRYTLLSSGASHGTYIKPSASKNGMVPLT